MIGDNFLSIQFNAGLASVKEYNGERNVGVSFKDDEMVS